MPPYGSYPLSNAPPPPTPTAPPAGPGFSAQFGSFAGGLRDVTRNLAAGFAKDPLVRAQYRNLNADVDAQRAQQKQQHIEQLMQNFNSYAEAIRGAGGRITPGLQRLLDQNVQLIGQISPEMAQDAQMMAQAAVEIGSQPQAGAAPEYKNVIGPDGAPLGMIDINDQNAVAALPPGSQLAEAAEGMMSEGQLGQEAYLRTLSRPQNTTNIKMPDMEGPIPEDHEAIRDPNGKIVRYQIIEGSPTDIARKERDRQTKQYGDIVIEDATAAIDMIDTYGSLAAGVGSITDSMPAVPARNLKAKVDAVKNNISIDRIQEMRRSNPNGAAVGNPSNQDLTRLETALGSLDTGQDPEELKKGLQRVLRIYNEIINKDYSGGSGTGTLTPQGRGIVAHS